MICGHCNKPIDKPGYVTVIYDKDENGKYFNVPIEEYYHTACAAKELTIL